MSSTRLILFVSFLAGSSQARTFARLVAQERATYEGGWPLGISGATCPSDAPVACPTEGGAINPSCCPTNQNCYGGLNPYCCPTGDCPNVVQNFPVCGNSTWNMYELDISKPSYFCCEPGQVGVLPIAGYAGICEPADQQVVSSRIATPASQNGVAATATVAPAGTSQSTLTSTLTNGGVTTITTAVAGSTATATTTSGVIGGYTPAPSNSVYVTGLSTGAKIGLAIAFGVAVILVIAGIVWCYRRRRTRREQFQAALLGAGYNNANQGGQPPMQQGQGQGQGQVQSPAPQYMQTPPQPFSSPVPDYKNPSVAVYPTTGYSQSPSPIQTQGSYVPPTPQYPGGPEPVEAPQAWERGVELGPGK